LFIFFFFFFFFVPGAEKLRELASKVRLGARPQQERDRSCPASVISEHNALEELVLQKMMQAANLQKARQSGGT